MDKSAVQPLETKAKNGPNNLLRKSPSSGDFVV